MKILNLYSGLGGNRKYWEGSVRAVESSQVIADQYSEFYPDDAVIVADAHQYLLDHYQEFDFIWSSPPCQSHSKMIRSGRNRKPRYPDFKLYEEIVFLRENFNGKWVVENVKPYYTPLIRPSHSIGRHLFWSNYKFGFIEDQKPPIDFINSTTVAGANALKEWLGLKYDKNIYYTGNHCPAQVLRNCVHPKIGKGIFDAFIHGGM